MELYLKRNYGTKGYTLGSLAIDGKVQYFTCEDEVREIEGMPVKEWKVQNRTAIPRGRYRVKLTMSNRFKKILPEVLNVDGFTGIRIHSGNTALDTEGCILVGLSRIHNGVANSRGAMIMLMETLNKAQDDIWLTVG